MTLPDRHDLTADPAGCPVCDLAVATAVDAGTRITPLQLVGGVARAVMATGLVALAARLGPDPIDLQPRVLRRA